MTSTAPPRTTPAEKLALIRYAALLDLEERGDGIGSRGLAAGGQSDLQFIFPRTRKLAAVSHATQVATSIFDERIRDLGVYHLFRLSAFWESQIHTAFLKGDIFDAPDAGNPLAILESISKEAPDPSKAHEGPQNLGTINPTKPNPLKKLSAIYANAIAAGKTVIPFFELE